MTPPASNAMSLMLSQRLVLQTVLAAQGEAERLRTAQQTLDLFEQSQTQLVQTAREMPGEDGRTLQTVYFGAPGVAKVVEAFIRSARAALGHAAQPTPSTTRSLDQLVEAVDGILQSLNAATHAFDQISTGKQALIMRELKAIVGDIQSVAREAKVVSFNAQVIAARAGAVGREFSVVASTLSHISTEVDTLARKGLALATR
jgi:methyl-accepting chemotaxis protein